MGIKVEWDNPEHTIIRITMEGSYTWDETDEADKLSRALLDTAPGKTHVIIVQDSMLPSNTLGHMNKISSSFGTRHPNLGIAVVVSTKSMVKMVMDIGARVYGPISEVKVVKTIEEAREYLDKYSGAG